MADNEDDLIQMCHKLWLDGKDVGFDYTKIDQDPQWDDFKTIEQDEEDKYFDDVQQ